MMQWVPSCIDATTSIIGAHYNVETYCGLISSHHKGLLFSATNSP